MAVQRLKASANAVDPTAEARARAALAGEPGAQHVDFALLRRRLGTAGGAGLECYRTLARFCTPLHRAKFIEAVDGLPPAERAEVLRRVLLATTPAKSDRRRDVTRYLQA